MTAAVGHGPITVARALARDLERRAEVGEVHVTEDLDVLGRRTGGALTRGYRRHLAQIGWSYDIAYRWLAGSGPGRRLGEATLGALSAGGLAATLERHRPDVVIAAFGAISGALGELRARGRLPLPVISLVCDPAGLAYWAHRGIDRHLLVWPEARAEVDRLAGPGRAEAVRPLVDERFSAPPTRDLALAELARAGLLPERWEPAQRLVLVSGGGWGIGDLSGAVLVALALGTRVIALAGHNPAARTVLNDAFGRDDRVRVVGFCEAMPALLCAADAVVHTTGGTTALEARMVGCPLINYGSGVAHVRDHARALASLGLAAWAPDRPALEDALAASLAGPRPAPMPMSGRRDAATVIIDLMGDRR